jgi:ankyrin repeat protein
VTSIHLAAQADQAEAVDVLLAAGADPALKDSLHGGAAAGWAHVGCHYELEARLRKLIN